MKDGFISGYRRKSESQLLRAIDECTSLSQLFALIQHENIVIQMHAQDGASNLTPKKLTPKEIIDSKDTPFERLKAEVRNSVIGSNRKADVPIIKHTKTKEELIRGTDECKTLSQLFAFIEKEKIVIQMHTQPGASNLTPKKLSLQGVKDEKDTPFERLKAEVRKSITNINCI